jgi:lipopolysaccharide transport system permease protein
MISYQFVPSVNMIFLPFFFILTFLASFGVGLLMSTLNLKYRDFRFIVPFIVQFGMYISPVAFSSSIVPQKYQLLYSLNPMVGVIDGFRWCIIGGDVPLNLTSLLISTVVIIGFTVLGIRYFRKTEKMLADYA